MCLSRSPVPYGPDALCEPGDGRCLGSRRGLSGRTGAHEHRCFSLIVDIASLFIAGLSVAFIGWAVLHLTSRADVKAVAPAATAPAAWRRWRRSPGLTGNAGLVT